MARFVKVGKQRIQLEAIRSVSEQADGEVVVTFVDGQHAAFPADEGRAILEATEEPKGQKPGKVGPVSV